MNAVVRATGLSIRYGKVQVLQGVDLELHHRQEVALVGRSGSGKTTLLLALAGLVPAAGELTWPGLPADPGARRAAIGMIFQAPSLIAELTALENVTLPLRLRGEGRSAAYSAAEEALTDVGLADALGGLPTELSGGQQQRVAVARVLVGKPRLLLADEPTGALDAASARLVVGLLRRQVQRDDGALLLATHDEDIAGQLPARLELRDGTAAQRAGAAR
jgi:ABC-type lipoprotein export system ATPase subunit